MGIPLQTVEYNDHGGGLDQISSPTKTPDNKATKSLNIDYSVDGAVFTRRGSSILNIGNQMTTDPKALASYDYRKSNGVNVQVVCNGEAIYHGLSSPTAIVTGLSPTLPKPDMAFIPTNDDEWLLWGNGIDTNLKFEGTTWTNLSIARPIAPSGVLNGGGNLLPGNYIYPVTFARTVAGIIVQESEISPESPTIILGDFGLATAGGALTLDDTTKTWVVNAYTGLDVVIVGGTGIGQTRSIASNTATQLTVTVAWTINPDATSDYEIRSKIDVTIPTSADTQVNARVLYRISPTSLGVAYRHATIFNNVDVLYQDNVAADGTIEAEYDNQAAPTSAIIEEYAGSVYYRDDNQKTDYLKSKPYRPWNVPETSRTILDGEIRCMKKIYNLILIGTDRSLWVDDVYGNLRKISSHTGVLNNRCAVGESALYILGTDKKVHQILPSDMQQAEIDLSNPISTEIGPQLGNIGSIGQQNVEMIYYSKPNVAKVVITAPVGITNNNTLIIYNEQQSQFRNQNVWQVWDNINANNLEMFLLAGEITLVSGDYNGFRWQIDNRVLDGDGAEVNGTATAATANTIEDTTVIEYSGTASGGTLLTLIDAGAGWTINEWILDQVYIVSGTGAGQTGTIVSNTADTLQIAVAWALAPDGTSVFTIGGFEINRYTGIVVRIVDGTGEGQVRTITSNTDRELTVSPNWLVTPNATSVYSIGAYENYHYTNWKFVLNSYEVLKQMWFMWINANASGNYNITMIMQLDFDTTVNNQIETLVNLRAENSIWGAVIWGLFIWGSRSVFLDRFRVYARYRAIRIGFYHNVAGQPWQINNFAISAQDKGLFFEPLPLSP